MASRDPIEVGIASRLLADLIAAWYDTNLKTFAKGQLLDLGCGKAPLYDTYSKFVDDTTLADWGNSLHKNEHLDVECDITQKLPFRNNSFDTVILSDVLEHIPNPSEVIAEVKRILRPNGTILINVPFFYWIHEAPHDYHRYTEFMLRKIVEDQDLRVIKLEPLAGGWGVLIDLISKLFGHQPRIARAVQRFGPKLLAKKIHSRTEFPLAYAMVVKKDAK